MVWLPVDFGTIDFVASIAGAPSGATRIEFRLDAAVDLTTAWEQAA